MTESSKKYYHNKAEKDYSEGRYEKPSGPIDLVAKSSDRFVDDCNAYDKGYDNAKKQSKK